MKLAMLVCNSYFVDRVTALLQALVNGIGAVNRETRRASDRIRLFQPPLERVV